MTASGQMAAISAARWRDWRLSRMPLAIDRLLAAGPPDAGGDRRVPRGARASRSSRAAARTFVFRGEADEVRLRHWIYGLPSTQPFDRVAGHRPLVPGSELPAGSRVEYKLEVVRKTAAGKLIRDPLNPHLAHDPFGANSVLHGRGYETPEWTLHDPDARPGEIAGAAPSRASVSAAARQFQVYLPARLPPEPALPAAGRPRRRRLPALLEPQDRARQPDPPARDPAADRGR